MVHALAIAAAASAGVSVAIAFELAVFKPWRDENWPQGVAEGVRSELAKLRDEFGLAVSEIHEDLRSLRSDRRREDRGRAQRLRDDELDDFRHRVGEGLTDDMGGHTGFEMHEREAEAYRERLRSTFESRTRQWNGAESGLRKRQSRTTKQGSPHHYLAGTISDTADVALAAYHGEAIAPPHTVIEPTSASKDLAGLVFTSAENKLPLSSVTSSYDANSTSWSTADKAEADQDRTQSGTAYFGADQTRETHTDSAVLDLNLDTNGLSQTLSQQHELLDTNQHDSISAGTVSDEEYDAAQDESDALTFEMLSIGDSDSASWHGSQIYSPSSPSPSGRSLEFRRDMHVLSDGEESWAEVSGSEAEHIRST